jgi:hypothetical protein
MKSEKKIIIFGLVMTVVILVSSVSIALLSTQTNQNIRNQSLGFRITYSVFYGNTKWGVLPNPVFCKTMINENGSVHFVYLENQGPRGCEFFNTSRQLNETEMHALQDLVENADVLGLNDWYLNSTGNYTTLHTMTIYVNGQEKTIQWCDSENLHLPEQLSNIVSSITSLILLM